MTYFILVAPQGFTGIANKGDKTVFHIVPHALPRTRNKDTKLRFVESSWPGLSTSET